jgi:hypothetical protein
MNPMEDYSFWYSDFWEVIISPEKLDTLISDNLVLRDKLDVFTTIIPLPKYIWEFDGYYDEWFVWSNTIRNVVEGYREFTKKDMLLLIDLIIQKAQEAKGKWLSLVFSGD